MPLDSHINTFNLLDNCNGDVVVKVMSSRVKEEVLRDFATTKSHFNVVPVVVQPYVEAWLTLSDIFCKLQMLHSIM